MSNIKILHIEHNRMLVKHWLYRTPLTIKTLKNVSIEVTYINIILAIYDKCTATILNNEKLKTFFSKIRNKTSPFSPLIFNAVLATAIIQE